MKKSIIIAILTAFFIFLVSCEIDWSIFPVPTIFTNRSSFTVVVEPFYPSDQSHDHEEWEGFTLDPGKSRRMIYDSRHFTYTEAAKVTCYHPDTNIPPFMTIFGVPYRYYFDDRYDYYGTTLPDAEIASDFGRHSFLNTETGAVYNAINGAWVLGEHVPLEDIAYDPYTEWWLNK